MSVMFEEQQGIQNNGCSNQGENDDYLGQRHTRGYPLKL